MDPVDLVDRVADLVEPFMLREDGTSGILPHDIGVHASVEKCRVNFVDNLDLRLLLIPVLFAEVFVLP